MRKLLAFCAIVLVLAGARFRVRPGPPLIWVGALLWAWANGFEQIGWPTLIVLASLALISLVLNFVLTTTISRRAGVSWRAIGGALVGAFIGGIVLSAIPILGTLLGAILGAMAVLWVVEYYVRQDAEAATAAVRAHLTGTTLSIAVQFFIACCMVSIFVWQAFF